METKQTRTSAFLSTLLPEVKTEVGFNIQNLIQAGSVAFIAAVLIMLAFFTFKKLF